MQRLMLLLSLTWILIGCNATTAIPTDTSSPKPNTPAPTPAVSADFALKSFPTWPDPAPAKDVQTAQRSESKTEDGLPYTCSVMEYDLAKTANQVVTFQPDANLLYLGNILQGQNVQRGLGSLNDVPVEPSKRQPLTVSIDLPIANSSRLVARPSLATVRDSVNELLSSAVQSGTVFGRSISYNQTESYSQEQSTIKLGLDLKFLNLPVELGGSYGQKLTQHTVTAYFVEKAFTVGVDLQGKSGAAAFLNETFTGEDWKALEQGGKVSPDNLPVYVASITYGRVMTFSMTATATEMAITGAIKALQVGNADLGQRNLLANADLRVATIGGVEDDAIRAIKQANPTAYFSGSVPLTSMKPISYELRSVKDNRLAAVSRTTKYQKTSCVQTTTANVKVTVLGIEATKDCDAGILEGNGEFFYSIDLNGETIASRSRADVVSIGDGGYHPINASRTLLLPRQSGSTSTITVSGQIAEADDTLAGPKDTLVADFSFAHRFEDSPPWKPGQYVARFNPASGCDVRFYYSVEVLPDS